tara:strand:+ start:563 stop:1105 length:543 start_codon:yes stop_codon:yes gene_type:complete
MSISVDIKLDPKISLKARRTLDGNIMIMDHEDIDIVLMLEKKKCVIFPKDSMSDKTYYAQDRIFKFLAKKGLINRGTVRGGNVFGSFEAEMLESKIPGIDQTQAFLFGIHQYIEDEKPYFKSSSQYNDDRLDQLLQPGPEDSTELGDVPQSDKKGSMDSRVRPYGYMYNYSLIREGESED